MFFIPFKIIFFLATAALVAACCWEASNADLAHRNSVPSAPLIELIGLDDEDMNEEVVVNPFVRIRDSINLYPRQGE